MKPRASTGAFALAVFLASLPASAAVTLQGTRIVHDAQKGRDVTIKASNTGGQPAMTQVWIDDGDAGPGLARANPDLPAPTCG